MIKKNCVSEKAIKNGLWLYLLQFFNTFLPLITIPYITRVLGPEQYGGVSISINIIGYMQVCIEYGFGLSATRLVSLTDMNDKKELSRLFTTVIYARLFLFFLCSLFLSVYFIFIQDIMSILCTSIMYAGLFGICFQQNWLFQGLQNMKYISLINIIARCVSVLLIFIFVKGADDVLKYCVFYSSTPIICGLLGTVVIWLKFDIKICRISLFEIRKQLRHGWNIFCTQLSAKVFSAIGVTFLGIISTKYLVGIYSAIYKIPSLFFVCWSPISQVLYPYSSKQMSDSFSQGIKFIHNIQKKTICIFLLMILIVGAFANIIILMLFGEEYAHYSFVLYPLLVWVLLAINNNFLGIQILLGGGFDKEYSKCFHVSVICTLLVNYALIATIGIVGAALAPMISELILTILICFEIRKIEKSILK